MVFFSLSQNTLLYKCNAFSMITKHQSHSVSVTSAVWSVTALLYNFTDRRFILIVNLSNFSIWFLFLSLLKELSPCHLKEAFYSFFLAYLICQHHYSRVLGLLLSKIMVTWTQALQYKAADLITEMLAPKWLMDGIHWTKGWFISWVGQSRSAWDFSTPLRTVQI